MNFGVTCLEIGFLTKVQIVSANATVFANWIATTATTATHVV